MSLAIRLCVFFLGALTFVLAGFSVALFLLARTYLMRQAEERLEAALATLAAAAEVSPEGVEWEAQERQLNVGREDSPQAVRWLVADHEGNIRDRSANLARAEPVLRSAGSPARDDPGGQKLGADGHPWLLRQLVITASTSPPVPSNAPDPGARKYRALVLTAGVSLQPLETTLQNLAGWLTGLSAGICLLAALGGQWFCRRALAPVAAMASTARSMGAAEVEARLPTPGTRDELDDLGAAFNDLLTRRQEAFERQRRFTGDASHQLRTPLAAMLGQVEVALRRERSPEEYERTLRLVKDQSIRLLQIVEMLLFLARADAEAKLPDLDLLEMDAWLTDHLVTWAAHPRAGDLRIKRAATGPLLVRAQGPLLGQLVDNLLENACKYSSPGSPVTIYLAEDGDVIALAVEDAGCGIAPEDLSHVFEPFYRSPHARGLGLGGVGLGLAVAQRIAAAFGGTLAVESHIGKGSRFVLQFPRNPDLPGDWATSAPPQTASAAAPLSGAAE